MKLLRRSAFAVLGAVVLAGTALLALPASASGSLLPSCAYGASVPWLSGYEQQHVDQDAWAYANAQSGLSDAGRRATATTFAAAEAAYIYGLPLVDLHDTVRNFKIRNEIISVNSLADASTRAVVSPNVDTAYSVAWIDLTTGPLVIDVPNTSGRFYTFQFMDAYTNSFAYLGSGSTGTAAGSYALLPPGWSGTLPAGVHAIRAPTNTLWLLGRTLVKGAGDLPAVRKIQQQYTATPLLLWQTGVRIPSAVLNSPPPTPKPTPPTGGDFIATLNQELSLDPPPTSQQCAITAFAPAGVQYHPATGAELVATDTLVALGDASGSASGNSSAAAVDAGTATAPRLIARAASTLTKSAGLAHHGWSVLGSWVGDYGDRTLARAIIATDLLGANVPRIGIYPTTYSDAQGYSLRGSRSYKITFPAGQTPPVKAFWSLTLYNSENFLVANPINRYAIGDRTAGLVRNRDGSLTLYLQHLRPASAAQRANWLPAPSGAFHLMLRLYLPKASALNGTWQFPTVVRTR
ncbi:MAG: DUF1254 domain-containing protein [Marmoricola sp.]